MYSFQSRVRYSEVDENLELSVTGMLNYLQDCSTFQSEDIGLGVRYLKDAGKAWMLSAWEILIDRPPVLGEAITVSTWPYSFKGIYGCRNFTIRDASGAFCVRADSVWFLYNVSAGVPMRISQEDVDAYGDCSEGRLPMPAMFRHIPVPEHFTEMPAVTIMEHHIDTNHHVNNAKYVEIAREAIQKDQKPQELRVEYRRAAVLGDRLIPRVTEEGGVCTAVLTGTDARPCAIVQLVTGRR